MKKVYIFSKYGVDNEVPVVVIVSDTEENAREILSGYEFMEHYDLEKVVDLEVDDEVVYSNYFILRKK